MSALRHTWSACCLLFALQGAHAQTWQASTADELLQHMAVNERNYAAVDAFVLRVDMASYRSATDAEPFDKAHSTVTRAGKRYRAEHMGIVTVQDDRLLVTVDSTERSILVGRPTDMMALVGAEHRDIIIRSATEVSKRPHEGGMQYRVLFRKGSYYERVEIAYDAQGWLQTLTLHWREAVREVPDDPASTAYRPKVVFRFGRPQPSTGDMLARALDPSRYVTLTPDGPRATAAWSNYEVIDTRLP